MKGRNVPPKSDATALPIDADDIAAVFFGVGTEELTDTLVNELVAAGWDLKELLDMRSKGARYNRKRHSLFMPVLDGDFSGAMGGLL